MLAAECALKLHVLSVGGRPGEPWKPGLWYGVLAVMYDTCPFLYFVGIADAKRVGKKGDGSINNTRLPLLDWHPLVLAKIIKFMHFELSEHKT